MFERVLEAIVGALRGPALAVSVDCVRLDRAHVHVHVRGTGLGLLRCGDHWSFRVGQFSTSLLVPDSAGSTEIALYGFGGFARRTVQLNATHQLPAMIAASTRAEKLRVEPVFVRFRRRGYPASRFQIRVQLERLRPRARF